MTRVVYIDVLFSVNLIINYFLILSAARMNKAPLKRFRYIAAAALASIYSIMIFLPETGILLSVAAKLLFSVSIVLTAFGRQQIRRFLRLLAGFYIVSFGFAGMMIAIWFAFKPKGMVINNGVFYFDISPSVLVLSAVVCYLVFGLLFRLTRKNAPDNMLYGVEITTMLGTVNLKGLLDTGNSLNDLFTDSPVVVVSYSAIEKLIPLTVRKAFSQATLENASDLNEYWSSRYRLIPFTSVSGTGLLPAFKPEKFSILKNKKNIELDNVLIAVSTDLGDEYKALINPAVLEVSENGVKKCITK